MSQQSGGAGKKSGGKGTPMKKNEEKEKEPNKSNSMLICHIYLQQI